MLYWYYQLLDTQNVKVLVYYQILPRYYKVLRTARYWYHQVDSGILQSVGYKPGACTWNLATAGPRVPSPSSTFFFAAYPTIWETMEVQGFSLLVNTRTNVLWNHVKLFHILNQKVMHRQELIAALVCVFDNWKGVRFLNLHNLHPSEPLFLQS